MEPTSSVRFAAEEHLAIHAPIPILWEALTRPDSMKGWMGDPEMELEVQTDWRIGSPFVITGHHHTYFRNTGVVRAFEPMKHLAYTHLSSLSRLPDKPENYAVIELELSPSPDATMVRLQLDCPTEAKIFEHLRFYWRGALHALRQVVSHPLHDDA